MSVHTIRAILLFLCLPAVCHAEESAIAKLAARLAAFGRTIPQEKVFVHMDNTSYHIGDTIWFSAYTRRTDTGRPSDVSGVLYVELYGQEGYLIERKLIQMKAGHGSGFFALTNQIQYAGFYELRAYTRWQLNWGLFEHEHTSDAEDYFQSKRQRKEYFRDYEKLYSRVFPVYDKPVEPGDFNHDMTLRAMRRKYESPSENRHLKLSLYPEGGNLVEGLPCRIAFEAAWDDGECVEGCLICNGDTARTLNRGRGIFEVVPSKGMGQDVLFLTKDGKTVKARLPKVEPTGVALRVEPTDSGWVATIRHTGDLQEGNLAVSLMHEGRSRLPSPNLHFQNGKALLPLKDELDRSGIFLLTIFDAQGRIFADRLFFNRGKDDMQPTLSIEGLKDEYQPYEPVKLKLKSLGSGEEVVSLTVRDDNKRDLLFDDSNILTEMLLSSEIRGFVPQPGWFFEADDSLHHAALDLLMMTQGWRRFDWQSMAVPGLWDIRQPAEQAPILVGWTFKNVDPYDNIIAGDGDKEDDDDSLDSFFYGDGRSPLGNNDSRDDYNLPQTGDWGTRRDEKDREETAYKRAATRKQAKHVELKVHAEQVMLDYDQPVECEAVTRRGMFHIQLLPFYGQSILFLSVADTTKWKKGKPYTWIQAAPDDEENDFMFLPKSRKLRRKIFVEPADHLARISWPYPHFVKPYNYYQDHLAPVPEEKGNNGEWVKQNGETLMREVMVKATRSGLRRFDDTWPIFAMDALEADNMSMDCGLSFERIMVGVDFGVGVITKSVGIGQEGTFSHRYGYGFTRRMLMDKVIPPDSIYARKYLISGTFEPTPPGRVSGISADLGTDYKFELSPGESMEYMGTGVWDKYVFYSDYSPRMYGDKQYYGSGEPKTTLVLYPYPDQSRRMAYRDRRYVLDGFAYPAEFYSPDYSRHIPSAEGKDYRRTLYWNPDVKFDEKGEAEILFYNNSCITQPSADAQGQANDGTLLWTE